MKTSGLMASARTTPLVLLLALATPPTTRAAAPSLAPQARYQRIEAQLLEAADHGRVSRRRAGIVFGTSGALLLGAGFVDALVTGPTAAVSGSGLSFMAIGAAFLGVGVGTLFAQSAEERLAEEVLVEHEVLTPELKLMATEKRLRAMAQDVRRHRILAAGFGAGLAAAGGVLYAINSPGNRGLPVVMIAAGAAAFVTRLLMPSEAERIWSNHARDFGIATPSVDVSAALNDDGRIAPAVALTWKFN